MTSRLLYYDLWMNADDDWYAERFTVIRMTGATEQDLQVLQANWFVKVFDENVLIIKDWKENNYIMKDRYTPSKYLNVYNMDTECIQKNNILDTQVRLGKDSIGKDKEKNTAPKVASNYKKFIAPELVLVQEYCNERANWIDAEAFLNHYETVGRVYGKDRKPVKDWKACIRTRESKNKANEPKTMDDWLKLKNELGIKDFTKKYWNEKVKEITLHFL